MPYETKFSLEKNCDELELTFNASKRISERLEVQRTNSEVERSTRRFSRRNEIFSNGSLAGKPRFAEDTLIATSRWSKAKKTSRNYDIMR